MCVCVVLLQQSCLGVQDSAHFTHNSFGVDRALWIDCEFDRIGVKWADLGQR